MPISYRRILARLRAFGIFPGSYFSKAESFIINNPNYPFAIVGISILDKDFKKYQLKHDAISRKEDYIEYEVAPFAPLEYGAWHTLKVNLFSEDIDGEIPMDKEILQES